MTTCHLHELSEQLANSEVNATALVAKDSRVYAALDGAELAVKNAMCFHMGEGMEMDGFRFIPDLVRLPYSACWFEFDHTRVEGISRFGVLAREIEDETVWFIFCRPSGQRFWQILGWASIASKTAKGINWALRPRAIEDYAPSVLEILHIVSAFLSAFNCSNVCEGERTPGEKLQRARAKRGKLPLFSFWTLALDLERHAAGEPSGGTHASPRLHLRRGHARKYTPGKWTWVQPCVVGSKKAGVVHKDYALTPRVSNAPHEGRTAALSPGVPLDAVVGGLG